MTTGFDPNKREPITGPWAQFMAQAMQHALLDEFFQSGSWTVGDIVFHGGTAIHISLDSPRFSEDLDFMISSLKAESIDRVIEKARKGLDKRMMFLFPGGNVTVKEQKTLQDGEGEVLRYNFVWKHPNKQNKVVVKTEFYTVKPEMLPEYDYKVVPSNKRVIEMSVEVSGASPRVPAMTSIAPIATPNMFYADKIVALGRRSYYKYRDVYDLWWLKTQYGVDMGDSDLLSYIRLSMSFYDGTVPDLRKGLARYLDEGDEFKADMVENLSVYLPEPLYRNYKSMGAFDQMMDNLKQETKRASALLKMELTESDDDDASLDSGL